MKVLLVGVSTRSMAQSATAAGYEVISLDYFGDRDQPAGARVYALGRDFHLPLTHASLAKAAHQLAPEADVVIFGSGVENDLALAESCRGYLILGNALEAVKKVRGLHLLKEVLSTTKVAVPETRFVGDPLPLTGQWLVKDLSRSGGTGVAWWDGKTVPRQWQILQRWMDGLLYSATFLADGQHAVLLGMTRQYAGVPELGATEFAWCGNVAPLFCLELEKEILKAAECMTQAFELRGLNGIDFILKDGTPFLLEVNPRFPSSTELLERVRGVNAFQLHVEACQGQLPSFQPIFGRRLAFGKGILYARKTLRIRDASNWMECDIADVPQDGEKIFKGDPICTILASGNDLESCWQNVLEKVRKLERELY